MSEGNLSQDASLEEKVDVKSYRTAGVKKFASQIREKKSFDHLKLKITSSKKLELITSLVPATMEFVFDSLISNGS